jgi:hypothetical protein
MTYEDALERIFEQCRGMTIRDVDFVLVVDLLGNPHAAIMYQAARNLDAQGLDTVSTSDYINMAGSQPARRQA